MKTYVCDFFFQAEDGIRDHCVTGVQTCALPCTNALHFDWRHCASDATRRYLLLQNAAFLPLYRGNAKEKVHIDDLQAAPLKSSGPQALEEIFAEISNDRMDAARKLLAWLKENPQPKEFLDAARVLIFLKGRDAHDYKFSSAVLEDYQHVSPAWRDRYLAASVFNLRGSGDSNNDLVKRTRAALRG